MAKFLRPRRGRKTTAINQNIILKRGEIFFEVPETGVGTGIGGIKMGDGFTPYSELPYFLDQKDLENLKTIITKYIFEKVDPRNNTTYHRLVSPIYAGALINGGVVTTRKHINDNVTDAEGRFISLEYDEWVEGKGSRIKVYVDEAVLGYIHLDEE